MNVTEGRVERGILTVQAVHASHVTMGPLTISHAVPESVTIAELELPTSICSHRTEIVGDVVRHMHLCSEEEHQVGELPGR